MLVEGKTQDQALAESRTGALPSADCIATIRLFRRCELRGKQVVESSPAFSDHRNITDEFLRTGEPGEEVLVINLRFSQNFEKLTHSAVGHMPVTAEFRQPLLESSEAPNPDKALQAF